MNLENAWECNQFLASAHTLLLSGCDDLFASTGLFLDPSYLSHALRDPNLSLDVCSSMARACESINDPARLPQAQAAVFAIAQAAACLRQALSLVAEMQGQNTRAITAYNDNL